MTHGDANRFNLPVKPTGGATLIDFETAEKAGREECEKMGRLGEALRDGSSRGGPAVEVEGQVLE